MVKTTKVELPIWYATKTAGMFREGQYYRTSQLGVLGRMARKVGILVLTDPPVKRQAALKPAKKAARPRKALAPTPVEGPDGEASV